MLEDFDIDKEKQKEADEILDNYKSVKEETNKIDAEKVETIEALTKEQMRLSIDILNTFLEQMKLGKINPSLKDLMSLMNYQKSLLRHKKDEGLTDEVLLEKIQRLIGKDVLGV